jgi:hypothetical protein
MERNMERNFGLAWRDRASIAVPSMVTSSRRARNAAAIGLVWLAGLGAGSVQAEPLAFAGFDRQPDRNLS